MVKNPPASAGDVKDIGWIPKSGRDPGGGHANPLQYPCLENPMDRGAWWATYSPWGHRESDTTEVTDHAHSIRQKKKKESLEKIQHPFTIRTLSKL